MFKHVQKWIPDCLEISKFVLHISAIAFSFTFFFQVKFESLPAWCCLFTVIYKDKVFSKKNHNMFNFFLFIDKFEFQKLLC